MDYIDFGKPSVAVWRPAWLNQFTLSCKEQCNSEANLPQDFVHWLALGFEKN